MLKLIHHFWQDDAVDYVESTGIRIPNNENMDSFLKRINKENDVVSIIKIMNTLLLNSDLQSTYYSGWQINFQPVSNIVDNMFALLKLEDYEIEHFQIKIPEQKIQKFYDRGQTYDFYSDIKAITLSAKSEVFVIDSYPNEDVIDLYLSKLNNDIRIQVLAKQPKDNFITVAKKFKIKRSSNFKVKLNEKCHDRLFFVDKKCYVIGQSLDQAATSKPTYVCEIHSAGTFRNVFQNLFDTGKTLI